MLIFHSMHRLMLKNLFILCECGKETRAKHRCEATIWSRKWDETKEVVWNPTHDATGLEPLTHPETSDACSHFDTFGVISRSHHHKGVKDVSISPDINTACVAESWTRHCPNGFSTHPRKSDSFIVKSLPLKAAILIAETTFWKSTTTKKKKRGWITELLI